MSLAAGARLGPYEILSLLGAGGNAVKEFGETSLRIVRAARHLEHKLHQHVLAEQAGRLCLING